MTQAAQHSCTLSCSPAIHGAPCMTLSVAAGHRLGPYYLIVSESITSSCLCSPLCPPPSLMHRSQASSQTPLPPCTRTLSHAQESGIISDPFTTLHPPPLSDAHPLYLLHRSRASSRTPLPPCTPSLMPRSRASSRTPRPSAGRPPPASSAPRPRQPARPSSAPPRPPSPRPSRRSSRKLQPSSVRTWPTATRCSLRVSGWVQRLR